MVVTYSKEPATVMYMALPNGEADVWLRNNIVSEEDEDGTVWFADEVYFHTTLTEDEVYENFDALFEYEGELTAPVEEFSVEDRLDVLEAAMLELVEVIVNG